MTPEDVKAIRDIAQRLGFTDKLTDDMVLVQTGADSLDVTEFVMEVEDHFQIELEAGVDFGLEELTLASLSRAVASKLVRYNV